MTDTLTRLVAELKSLRAKGIGGALVDDIEVDGVTYIIRLDTADEDEGE